MPRGPRHLTAAAIVSWAAFGVGALYESGPLRLVAGLAVVLVIPGWAAGALASARRGPERPIIGLGMALAAAIGVALAAGATTSSNEGSVIAWCAALTVALLVAVRRHAAPSVRSAWRDLRPSWGRATVLVLAGAASTAMIAVAVEVSWTSEEAAWADARTVVTLLPDESSTVAARPGAAPWTTTHHLTITNREGAAETYEVEVTLPGMSPTLEQVDLSDGETWSRQLTSQQRGAVTVRVWGGTPSEPNGYREVRTGTR